MPQIGDIDTDAEVTTCRPQRRLLDESLAEAPDQEPIRCLAQRPASLSHLRVGNAVGLGLYIPTVGVFIAVFSVLFLEAWYVLIAARLYRLGRAGV